MISVEDMLREADKSWNAMTIGRVIMTIMKHQPELTMLDIEDMFRSVGSKTTYLVAWPVDQMPATLRSINIDNTPAKYGLWVCLNGPDDLMGQLACFALTIEQNRTALRECGFICPRGSL
jgi:hypothetical protein